jgi:type II secretory pathway component PulJ
MARLRHVHRPGSPAAFTLVELLVSSTIALVVMGAVASLFGIFSRTSTNTQAIVDLSSRMRSTANRLRDDLAGLTAPLTPPLSPESDAGYFELIEGPWTDARDGSGAPITASSATSILADTDDVLLFTTRSSAGRFEGHYNGSQIESSTAEVAWFCRPSATQPVSGLQLQTLYRRQLLVVGYVGASPFFVAGSASNNQILGSLPAIYSTYDISLRPDSTVAGALVPNTLGDLTRRENRFFHGPTWASPFPNTVSGSTNLTFDGTTREGEDVVLTNVIAFDVRVFDPDARPKLNGTTVVCPNEQGYAALGTLGTAAAAFKGCFLDLGGNARFAAVPNLLVPDLLATGSFTAITALSGTAASKSGLAATYDTWSTAYETNGLNEDNDTEDLNGNGSLDAGEDRNANGILDAPLIDEGVNGLDDDVDGIPDDPDETETAAPYSRPLPAIEIRIRCYDPTSREIRQTTVRHTFTN